MLIDTHTHLQFKAFVKNRDTIIKKASAIGVEKIIAVGTDLESSIKAVEIAQKNHEVFASVGIHPHHLFKKEVYTYHLEKLEKLLLNPKVVAVGETGLDNYVYKNTKYDNYKVDKNFISRQIKYFAYQINLAVVYNKTLIIHNRRAAKQTLEVLEKNWSKSLNGKTVFHLCEPDEKLLIFAKKHRVFISFAQDLMLDSIKQRFIKKIPLYLLVLETDSPFISKEPANIKLVLEFISKLLKIESAKLEAKIFENSLRLFNFS